MITLKVRPLFDSDKGLIGEGDNAGGEMEGNRVLVCGKHCQMREVKVVEGHYLLHGVAKIVCIRTYPISKITAVIRTEFIIIVVVFEAITIVVVIIEVSLPMICDNAVT